MKKYSQKDLKIARLVTIVFVVLYFWATSFFLFRTVLELTPVATVIAFSGAVCFPILIILSLCMTIERSYYLEFRNGENITNTKSKKAFWGSIILIILFGIIVFLSVMHTIAYVEYCWAYIEEVYNAIVVKLVVTGGWLICWMFIIFQRNTITRLIDSKIWLVIIGFIIAVSILIYATIFSESYGYKMSEDGWFKQLEEEANQKHYELYGEYLYPTEE